MAKQDHPRILWDVVEEHLEEAEFVWTLWQDSLDHPKFTLEEVGRLDEDRLLAHVDALLLEGQPVVDELLVPALADPDPAVARVAAFSLLKPGDSSGLARVVEALEAAEEPSRGALRQALERSDHDGVSGAMRKLLAGRPDLKPEALRVLTFRGEPDPSAVTDLLGSSEPRAQVAALLASLREASPRAQAIDECLKSPEPQVADLAMTIGMARKIHGAWDHFRSRLGDAGALPRAALGLCGSVGTLSDHELLLEQLDGASGASCGSLLWALGFSGRVAAAELATGSFDDSENNSRLAAEAFCSITGLDLKEHQLTRDPVDDDDFPEFEDDDLEADLRLTKDDFLLLPDAEGVRAWWSEHSGDFEARTRYLRGSPRSAEGLWAALADGTTRRRHIHALALVFYGGGDCVFEPSSPTRWQLRDIERIRGLAPLDDANLGA